MMEDDLKNESKTSGNQPDLDKKSSKDLRILGLNLLILVGYSIISRFTEGGPLLDAGFLAIHICFCMIMAGVARNWAWVLSGVTVLIIGFATCVEVLWK